MAIDVYQAAAARQAQPIKATQQNAAVAADDQREAASFQHAAHGAGQLQGEGTDRVSVANRGAGLCLERVRRSFERQHLRRSYRLCQAGIDQGLRRSPGTGLMSRPRWPKAQIARCENEAERLLFAGKQFGCGCKRSYSDEGCLHESAPCHGHEDATRRKPVKSITLVTEAVNL